MAELHYKDGGTWRKAKELHYRDAGTWRKLKEAWYRDGGTWREVFSAGGVVNPLPIVNTEAFSIAPADAVAAIEFTSAGVLRIYGAGVLTQSWYLPNEAGIGSAHWVRVSVTSGSGPNAGSTTGVWHSLSSLRNWSWQVTSNFGGVRSGVITVEVASDSAGANVVASKSGITMTAIVESA